MSVLLDSVMAGYRTRLEVLASQRKLSQCLMSTLADQHRAGGKGLCLTVV